MLMYLPLDKERLCIKNIKSFTLSSNHNAVEAKLHGESKVIQRCFDDNNDDNKR